MKGVAKVRRTISGPGRPAHGSKDSEEASHCDRSFVWKQEASEACKSMGSKGPPAATIVMLEVRWPAKRTITEKDNEKWEASHGGPYGTLIWEVRNRDKLSCCEEILGPVITLHLICWLTAIRNARGRWNLWTECHQQSRRSGGMQTAFVRLRFALYMHVLQQSKYREPMAVLTIEGPPRRKMGGPPG